MRGLFAFAALALLGSTADAADKTVALSVGGRQSVAVERKMETLYVADPAIASVGALDGTHITLVGRHAGRTLIVAVDEKGKPILSAEIVVRGERPRGVAGGTLTLQRGSERVTYTCLDRCQVASRGGKAPAAPLAVAPMAAPNFAPVTAAMPVGVMPGG